MIFPEVIEIAPLSALVGLVVTLFVGLLLGAWFTREGEL